MSEFDAARAALKAALAMPAPMLRAMSGGAPVEIAGRTLDPRLQFIAHQAKDGPSMISMSPAEARDASSGGLAMVSGQPEEGVRWEELRCDLSHGVAPARAYRPERQDPDAPLLVYLHMGGGVIGDLETHHAFCTMIASIARCAVLSIDYRLAPEHRFPAGVDDSLQAVRWGRNNAARFGAPAGRVAVAGDSMGGNFAAVICQDLRAAGEPQPDLQVLIYPAVDAKSQTQSMTVFGDAYPLTSAMMDWFMEHYMAEGQSPDDPRLSPIKADDLSGLAPAIVITAGFDPLTDQGEVYAHRLKVAGVPVLHRRYDSLCHGFTAMTGAIPAADTASREIAGLIREAFEGRLAAVA
jgi:acetyl esterase/lipase